MAGSAQSDDLICPPTLTTHLSVGSRIDSAAGPRGRAFDTVEMGQQPRIDPLGSEDRRTMRLICQHLIRSAAYAVGESLTDGRWGDRWLSPMPRLSNHRQQ